LGSLGGSDIFPSGINDAADIVGDSLLADQTTRHAFLYTGGVMRDLNSLIAPGSGWELESAASINNTGQIVGEGLMGGDELAFLLTPVPEPGPISLWLAGGAAALLRRSRCFRTRAE